MATVKKFIRSYAAAINRAEKEQQRTAREAAKRFKKQQKEEAISNASEAVNNYNYYVDLIQTLHKNCTDRVDWDQIISTPMPDEPRKEILNEERALQNLNGYKPSLIEKIFGASKKKVNILKELIEDAKRKDENEFVILRNQYLAKLEDWELLQKISKGVKTNDPNSYREALQYFNPFSDIGELGNRIEFSFSNNEVDVNVHINGQDIIPTYELKQLATGKLSKRSMTKSKFNELYQDHICRSLLRISREFFAFLPLSKARISAIGKVLNSTTGHLEEKPILSVIFVPETINLLNLNSIDPSDSIQNFVHNMKFTRTKGFSPIEKVKLK